MLEYLVSLAVDPSAWIALATLIVMEVVLGIDNRRATPAPPELPEPGAQASTMSKRAASGPDPALPVGRNEAVTRACAAPWRW